jgi:hypothetical protein
MQDNDRYVYVYAKRSVRATATFRMPNAILFYHHHER